MSIKGVLIVRPGLAVNNRLVRYLASAGYVLEAPTTENASAVEEGNESLLARGSLVDVAGENRPASESESIISYCLEEEENIRHTPIGEKIFSIITKILVEAYVEPLFNIYDLVRQRVNQLTPTEKPVALFYKATIWMQPNITSKTILGTRLLETRGTKAPTDLSLLIVGSNSPNEERRAVRLLTNYPGLEVDAIIAINKEGSPTLIYSRRNGGQYDQ